jgi:hypothetical protein
MQSRFPLFNNRTDAPLRSQVYLWHKNFLTLLATFSRNQTPQQSLSKKTAKLLYGIVFINFIHRQFNLFNRTNSNSLTKLVNELYSYKNQLDQAPEIDLKQ